MTKIHMKALREIAIAETGQSVVPGQVFEHEASGPNFEFLMSTRAAVVLTSDDKQAMGLTRETEIVNMEEECDG